METESKNRVHGHTSLDPRPLPSFYYKKNHHVSGVRVERRLERTYGTILTVKPVH